VTMDTQQHESVVVFPLGNRRFALPTMDVVELFRQGAIQTFPHTTSGIAGVLVRRGEILPVWDVAQALIGADHTAQKYFLIVQRNFAGRERTAVLISGECQMLNAELAPPPGNAAAHVRGVFWMEGEEVEVLDLERLGVSDGQQIRPPLEEAKGGEQI
jgi:chemotaxis signal transduction protein